MTRWGVTLRGVVVATALLTACSDDGADGATTTTERSTTAESTTTTVTAPERPASTTTTAYDPAAVEGQVEATYLRSWDVYADAVYDLELDEQALTEVYAEEALTTVTAEIERRISEKAPSLVWVEHDYELTVAGPEATVLDHFVNHQVRVDPSTREPIEEDPNERTLINFQLRLTDGHWRVISIERITS